MARSSQKRRAGASSCPYAFVFTLCAALFLGFAHFLGGCQQNKLQRPNILIITVDTLRADRVGCYGYPGGLTPNVDALAKDGIVFERGIAQVPLTVPSHTAIFTGTYPFHNGVQDFTAQPLGDRFRTLAESLKANGYSTGAIVSSFVLDRSWGLARGFDSYDDAFAGQEFLQKNLGLVERRAQESVDHAVGWLETHSNQPFFLWLHLYDPHSPYDPPEPFRTRFARELYDGEIAYADSHLGRLFAWLKQAPNNLYDNTLIVFLSDHGESLGEHGEKEHGFFVYDSTVRVPLIVKPPRGARLTPQHVSVAVETIQVGPTVLEMAGVQDPIQKQFQATSLLPLITGKPHGPERPAYSETFYPANSFGWSPLRSMQTEHYHFIEAPKQELYEHPADPSETKNIAVKNGSVATNLQAQLTRLLATYPPPAGNSGESASSTTASPEVLEKLRSLGYVAYRAPTAANSKLADPKDKVSVFQDILRATDQIQLGNFAAARALLASAQQKEPQLYLIPFLLGEAASHTAQWKEAEKQFGRAVALNPGFEQARMGLARALGLQGKIGPARDLIGTLLSTNPQNFRAWFLLAQMEAKDDPKSSREALDKVIGIQPNFALAYRDRGLLSVREQTYVSASEDLSRAVQMGLHDVLTYNSLGICYSRMNRLDDAVESYRRAIAADPTYAQAHLNLGFAFERMNQPDLKKKEYAEACRLDPRICPLVAGR
ncbi:MAG TPA: sulfatase-like hydrolase/transferase [Candidatus Acidoferrum sp.]|nr:sulfatase-like hydrolase/transferase [Candidatus Acidoferrum sp.]